MSVPNAFPTRPQTTVEPGTGETSVVSVAPTPPARWQVERRGVKWRYLHVPFAEKAEGMERSRCGRIREDSFCRATITHQGAGAPIRFGCLAPVKRCQFLTEHKTYARPALREVPFERFHSFGSPAVSLRIWVETVRFVSYVMLLFDKIFKSIYRKWTKYGQIMTDNVTTPPITHPRVVVVVAAALAAVVVDVQVGAVVVEVVDGVPATPQTTMMEYPVIVVDNQVITQIIVPRSDELHCKRHKNQFNKTVFNVLEKLWDQVRRWSYTFQGLEYQMSLFNFLICRGKCRCRETPGEASSLFKQRILLRTSVATYFSKYYGTFTAKKCIRVQICIDENLICLCYDVIVSLSLVVIERILLFVCMIYLFIQEKIEMMMIPCNIHSLIRYLIVLKLVATIGRN